MRKLPTPRSTDLRKGNIVLYDGKPCEITVGDLALMENNERHKRKDKHYAYVAINDDWLLNKFYFHKDNYGIRWKTKDDKKTRSNSVYELCVKRCKIKGKWVYDICTGKFEDSQHICYVTYVHELQNAYQIIYKKELQLKYRISIQIQSTPAL